jgi:hypothetical protein
MKKKPGLIKLAVLLFASILAIELHAAQCDEFSPTFEVNGVNKWQGLTAEEIVLQEGEITSLGNKEHNAVALKRLVAPYAQQGTLIVFSCDGKSQSYEVIDLLADAPDKAGIVLTLSKKNFLKLTATKTPKPILKKVYRLRLIP